LKVGPCARVLTGQPQQDRGTSQLCHHDRPERRISDTSAASMALEHSHALRTIRVTSTVLVEIVDIMHILQMGPYLTIEHLTTEVRMRRFPPRHLLISIMIFAVLVAGPSVLTAAQDATPDTGDARVVGPEETYGGATLGEWTARHWQWQMSFPPELNPGYDATGATCGLGQNGLVFFLPSLLSESEPVFTCVVPMDAAIFVPIVNGACSTVEEPPFFGRTEAELRACAMADVDSLFDVYATVDGIAVEPMEDYRTTTPLFTFNFTENNIFGAAPGMANAVGDGYQFIIAPLPVGEHEIVVGGTWREPEIQQDTATYRIIVEAPQVIEPEGSPEAATPGT
jgi:hypothetical protein